MATRSNPRRMSPGHLHDEGSGEAASVIFGRQSVVHTFQLQQIWTDPLETGKELLIVVHLGVHRLRVIEPAISFRIRAPLGSNLEGWFEPSLGPRGSRHE